MLDSLGNLRLTFLQPWWLLLIPILIPPLVLLSMRSLAGLGKVRRAIAILLRTSVVSLLVAGPGRPATRSTQRVDDDDLPAGRLPVDPWRPPGADAPVHQSGHRTAPTAR